MHCRPQYSVHILGPLSEAQQCGVKFARTQLRSLNGSTDLFSAENLQSLHPVCIALVIQFLHLSVFGLIARNNELATALCRQIIFLTVLVHQLCTVHARVCHARTRLIVHSCVYLLQRRVTHVLFLPYSSIYLHGSMLSAMHLQRQNCVPSDAPQPRALSPVPQLSCLDTDSIFPLQLLQRYCY